MAANEPPEAARVPASPCSSSSEVFVGEESSGSGEEEPEGSLQSSGSLGPLLEGGQRKSSREELLQLRGSAASECPVEPDILAAIARISIS